MDLGDKVLVARNKCPHCGKRVFHSDAELMLAVLESARDVLLEKIEGSDDRDSAQEEIHN